jgi:hypothetical protein
MKESAGDNARPPGRKPPMDSPSSAMSVHTPSASAATFFARTLRTLTSSCVLPPRLALSALRKTDEAWFLMNLVVFAILFVTVSLLYRSRKKQRARFNAPVTRSSSSQEMNSPFLLFAMSIQTF